MRIDLNNSVAAVANSDRKMARCGVCKRSTSHIVLGMERLRCGSCGEVHVEWNAPGLPAGKRRIEGRIH